MLEDIFALVLLVFFFIFILKDEEIIQFVSDMVDQFLKKMREKAGITDEKK